MKAMGYGICLASSLLANIVATGAWAAPPGAEQLRAYMLASSCLSCHGQGQDNGAIPSLQGKSKDFVVKALTDYKADTRQATIMNKLAKGYTDEEIPLIATWLSQRQPHQKPSSP